MKKPDDEAVKATIIDMYNKRPLPDVMKYINDELRIDAWFGNPALISYFFLANMPSTRSVRTWLRDWGARRIDQESSTADSVYSTPDPVHQQPTRLGPLWTTVHRPRLEETISPTWQRPDSPLLAHTVPARGGLTLTLKNRDEEDETMSLPIQRFGRSGNDTCGRANAYANSPHASMSYGYEDSEDIQQSRQPLQRPGQIEEVHAILNKPNQTWSAQRTSLVSQDSGYYSGSNRASTATSVSIPSVNLNPLSSISEDPSRLTFLHERDTHQICDPVPNKTSRNLIAKPKSSTLVPKGKEHPQTKAPFSKQQAQTNYQYDGLGLSETDEQVYSLPHAAPSQCTMKHTAAYISITAHEGCQFCGATPAHAVACDIVLLRAADLKDRLQDVRTQINHRDHYGNAPVHFLASSKPTLAHLQLFHAAGADLSVTNNYGETLLHVLDTSNLDRPKKLLSFLKWCFANRVPLRQRTMDGQTVFHSLLRNNLQRDTFLQLSEFFTKLSFDIHARDSMGTTPAEVFSRVFRSIHSTKRISEQALNDQQLYQKDLAMLEVVNKSFSEPTIEDADGRNAIGCLAYMTRTSPGIPCSLQDPNARFKLLQQCLRPELDVNHYDKQGSTPLHSFVFKVRLLEENDEATTARYVRALIDAGADYTLRDRNGDTALHLACKYGRLHCTQELVQAGSSLNAINHGGKTVISEAMWWLRHDANGSTGYMIRQCIDEVSRFGGRDSVDPIYRTS